MDSPESAPPPVDVASPAGVVPKKISLTLASQERNTTVTKSSSGSNSPSYYVRLERRLTSFLREQYHWRYVKMAQIGCVVYIVIYTFGDFRGATVRNQDGFVVDPVSEERTAAGLLGDAERPIVATNVFQMVCISIARITAFYMYPTCVLVYLSKLRATTNLIAKTPLGMFVCDDWHDLHIYCGWSIFVNSILHSIFHIIRWVDQGNLLLLVTNRSGLSGLIVLFSLFLVCIPMMFENIKRKLRYEIRKGFHYFFYIFAFAMAFHAPTSALPNGGFAAYIFGGMLIWYLMDATYCSIMMTEKIDTVVFDVLPSGVQMTLAVSDRYLEINGGYCYICLPWVTKSQWHAFSLFEHPTNPNLKQVFMLKNGDWTNTVHFQLQRDTVRPIWIQGPFISPYNRSVDYDNQIMVASGIGITPALSVLRAQKDTRRTNLIWCVRDPALLEFFLERAYLDHSGWNLFFYTGKRPLISSRIDQLTSTNVQVIRGRPDLGRVIRNIIYGIESQRGCPQQYMPDQKQEVTEALLQTLEHLENQENMSTQEKLGILADTATEFGFQFTNQLYDLGGLFGSSDPIKEEDETDSMNDDETERSHTRKDSPTNSNAGSEGSWDDDKILDKLIGLIGGDSAGTQRVGLYISPLSMTGESSRSMKIPIVDGTGRISNAGKSPFSTSGNSSRLFRTSTVTGEQNSKPGKMMPGERKIGKLSKRHTRMLRRRTGATNLARSINPNLAQQNKGFRTSVATDVRGLIGPGLRSSKIFSQGPFQRDSGIGSVSDVPSQRQSHYMRQVARDIMVEEAMEIGFKPWEESDETEDAEAYVLNLDENTLASWGLLYCGGSKVIESSLKDASRKYKVELHAENFSW